VHRLHETRERLGLAGKLYFDHRTFLLEPDQLPSASVFCP